MHPSRMATLHSPEAYPQHASQYPTNSDLDTRRTHPSRTPSTGSIDFPLLSDTPSKVSQSRTISPTFVSSPLKPSAAANPPMPPSQFANPRTHSRRNMIFNRVPSEESQALASQPSSLTSNRTSMLLYRVADEDEQLIPAPRPNHHSRVSNSGDSVFSVSYDSKYPSGAHTPQKLIPYPFDPTLHIDTPEDDDALHDPSDTTPVYASSRIAVRGYLNIGVLILVILALLLLFIFYPIWHYVIQGNGTVP